METKDVVGGGLYDGSKEVEGRNTKLTKATNHSFCVVTFFGRRSSGYGVGSTQKHKLALTNLMHLKSQLETRTLNDCW